MENATQPVRNASHRNLPCLKVVLMTIVIFSAGVVVGNLVTLDSSFIRLSSLASKASSLSFLNKPHVTTEGEGGEDVTQDDGKFKYKNGTVRNLRLAFVGDSITRYQYISLVSYLHSGRWIENSDTPNPVKETDFGSYQNFFAYVSQTVLEGTEACDCFRAAVFNPVEVFENRYYAENHNYVSVFLKLGGLAGQGHWEPGSVYGANRTRFEKKSYFVPPTWRYNWQDLILNHIAKLEPKPDFVVLNAGHWAHDLVPEVFEAIRNVTDMVGIKAIYATTTKSISDRDSSLRPHDVQGCEILEYCLNRSWTANITKNYEHYWDTKHFTARVNRMLNEQLMDLLDTIT
ncbi:hypothetical protein MHU86_15108 [Fragilaria crotonensis]|nr:hypothetical protein MHU86_15108 [Fragilaria crotonensis]